MHDDEEGSLFGLTPLQKDTLIVVIRQGYPILAREFVEPASRRLSRWRLARRSLFQVDVLHDFDAAPEKSLAQPAEFLGGIRREKAEPRMRAPFFD